MLAFLRYDQKGSDFSVYKMGNPKDEIIDFIKNKWTLASEPYEINPTDVYIKLQEG